MSRPDFMSLIRPDFYLAHPLDCHRKILDAIHVPLQELGTTVSNPFYDKKLVARQKVQMIERGEIHKYDFPREKSVEIVRRDLSDIGFSKAVLAYMPEPSIGTSMEIFYSSHVLGKPTWVITEKYAGHPWIQTYADRVWPSIDDFIMFMEEK